MQWVESDSEKREQITEMRRGKKSEERRKKRREIIFFQSYRELIIDITFILQIIN